MTISSSSEETELSESEELDEALEEHELELEELAVEDPDDEHEELELEDNLRFRLEDRATFFTSCFCFGVSAVIGEGAGGFGGFLCLITIFGMALSDGSSLKGVKRTESLTGLGCTST